MIVPSRRWFVVAALLAAIAPVTLVWPAAVNVLFAADVLWVLALIVDVLRIGALDLATFPVTREAPPAFSVGRPLPVTYRWRNMTRLPLHIRVREVVPPLLEHPVRPRAEAGARSGCRDPR